MALIVLTCFNSPLLDLLCFKCCSVYMCVFYCFFSERKIPFYPPALLNWKVTQEKVPWGIVLLLGGGFALAKGCEVTSLAVSCSEGPLLSPRGWPKNRVPPALQPWAGSTNCTFLEDRDFVWSCII